METIQVSVAEYKMLQEELALLKNTELIGKLIRLVDLMYQEKYGLYLGNYTNDLTEHTVNGAWENQNSSWDHV